LWVGEAFSAAPTRPSLRPSASLHAVTSCYSQRGVVYKQLAGATGSKAKRAGSDCSCRLGPLLGLLFCLAESSLLGLLLVGSRPTEMVPQSYPLLLCLASNCSLKLEISHGQVKQHYHPARTGATSEVQNIACFLELSSSVCAAHYRNKRRSKTKREQNRRYKCSQLTGAARNGV